MRSWANSQSFDKTACAHSLSNSFNCLSPSEQERSIRPGICPWLGRSDRPCSTGSVGANPCESEEPSISWRAEGNWSLNCKKPGELLKIRRPCDRDGIPQALELSSVPDSGKGTSTLDLFLYCHIASQTPPFHCLSADKWRTIYTELLLLQDRCCNSYKTH